MLKYLLELKNRLFLLFFLWISLIFTCYVYKENLLFVLVSYSNSLVTESNSLVIFNNYFIFTNITEVFSTNVLMVIFISNQFCMLYFIYHLFLFLFYSLYNKEYVIVKIIVKLSILFWILSVIFLNLFLVSISWNFFLGFQNQVNFKIFFEAKILEYFKYYKSLYFVCVYNSQIFIIIGLLFNFIDKSIEQFKLVRKISYFFIIIFSTLITPPDVISQLISSFILCFFFELLLLVKLWKSH